MTLYVCLSGCPMYFNVNIVAYVGYAVACVVRSLYIDCISICMCVMVLRGCAYDISCCLVWLSYVLHVSFFQKKILCMFVFVYPYIVVYMLCGCPVFLFLCFLCAVDVHMSLIFN